MEDTAQNNGINITYPTFDDGSNPQPTPQQPSQGQNQPQQPQDQTQQVEDLGMGDFQGKIDTHPTNSVHDSLDDIMPNPRKPKAMDRTPTNNSLAEPMEKKNGREDKFLIPQDNGINLNDGSQTQANTSEDGVTQTENAQQPQATDTEVEVVDLGNTPQPESNDGDLDVSMPDVQNMPSQAEESNDAVNMKAPEDEVLEHVSDRSNGKFHNGEVNVSIDAKNKINELLEYTIEKGASDLHISVGYPPVIRVDGELEEVNEQIIDPVEAEELILPLMGDDKRELLEVNKEIDFAYTHEGKYNGRFRINAFYAMRHLSAAFRLIPNRIRTIDELKLPQIYHQFTKLRQGMVLVTGPTGHGKSTTIAAMLEDINRNRFSRIVTIEDPIEYVFQGKKSLIDQREMGQDTHSWPIALKSAMRQDPDIILVGEMRDYETISAAITLAETGHLVFATLHTNNSAQSIDRMIDVFPEEQQSQVRAQLSNILEVVIAQRLIPLDAGGRRAVAEILVINPAVQTLIRESKSHQIDNVIRTSSDVGMISLERSLVDLVREGVISIKTAQEFAVYPEEVSRLLKS